MENTISRALFSLRTYCFDNLTNSIVKHDLPYSIEYLIVKHDLPNSIEYLIVKDYEGSKRSHTGHKQATPVNIVPAYS